MMRRRVGGFCVVFIGLTGMGGCTTTGMVNEIVVDPLQPRTTMASSAQATKRSELEQVDLTALVRARTIDMGCASPGDFERRRVALGLSSPPIGPDGGQDRDYQELYFYLSKFDSCVIDTSRARNQIQDHVLLVSDRQCRNYVTLLQTYESAVDFGTGALATLTGGLSAIFTNKTTARALGGSAGIISGVGAEFDSAYFKQQMVGVLLSGMNMERREIHADIRKSQGTSSYTLEAALKDAVRYNAACSLATAVDRLKHEIAQEHGVGLDVARQIVQKTNVLAAELDMRDQAKRPEARKFLEEHEVTKEKDRLATELLTALDDRTVAEQKDKEAQTRIAALEGQLQGLSETLGAAQLAYDQALAVSPEKAAEAKERLDKVTAEHNLLKGELERAKKLAVVAAKAKAESDQRYQGLYSRRECLSFPVETSIMFVGSGDVADSVEPDAEQKLDQAARRIACSGHTKVTLTGYTDSVGPATSNEELALKRAQYVEQHLKSRLTTLGSRAAIMVVADGERTAEAAHDGQEQEDKAFRRVDIRSSP